MQRDPALAAKLIYGGNRYQVHHRFVLEFAHLAGELDVNATSELVAVAKPVHESIGLIWNELRPYGDRFSLVEMKQAMNIVDRFYGRWFNSVFNKELQMVELETAQRGALREVQVLIQQMRAR